MSCVFNQVHLLGKFYKMLVLKIAPFINNFKKQRRLFIISINNRDINSLVD